jgi:hypothetical protein
MRIEIHHDFCHEPVVIDTDEGHVSMKVGDGTDNGTACITITPKEARAIAGVLHVVAQEADT